MSHEKHNDRHLLTKQLLAFARKTRFEPKPTNLNSLTTEFGEMLENSVGLRIEVQPHLRSRLPPALVDPVHLEMAVLNVLINARNGDAEGRHRHDRHIQGAPQRRCCRSPAARARRCAYSFRWRTPRQWRSSARIRPRCTRSPEGRIELLFTDLAMPGSMNGLAPADAIRERSPGIGALMTTGFNDELLSEGKTSAGADVLGKPYRRTELADRIRAARNRRGRERQVPQTRASRGLRHEGRSSVARRRHPQRDSHGLIRVGRV